jgi:hypothetical protein
VGVFRHVESLIFISKVRIYRQRGQQQRASRWMDGGLELREWVERVHLRWIAPVWCPSVCPGVVASRAPGVTWASLIKGQSLLKRIETAQPSPAQPSPAAASFRGHWERKRNSSLSRTIFFFLSLFLSSFFWLLLISLNIHRC